MPTPWNHDPSGYEQQLLSNVAAVLRGIAATASRGEPPTIGMAQEWHRRTYDRIPLPVGYYAGEVRDSDARFPELCGYEVAVGSFRGTPSALVPQQLAEFETRAQTAAAALDVAIPVGTVPGDGRQLQGILALCAVLHGEWIRIHPFANGNGRTARTWANWAALRYGLPPFVTVKPRPPGNPYAVGASGSMNGDHRPMIATLLQMLNEHLDRSNP